MSNEIPPTRPVHTVYDEELNYQSTPGWQMPIASSSGKALALTAPLAFAASTGQAAWGLLTYSKRPMLTRPMSLRSLTTDGLRLTAKTIAWTTILTSPLTVPMVIDHNNGAISSRLFPAMSEGKLMSAMVETDPEAVGPIDIERGYNRVAGWRESFIKDGDIVTPQRPWLQHYLIPSIGIGRFSTNPVAIPPVFRRPMQAGPTIVDAMGKELSRSKTPYVIFEKFDDIAPIIVNALAFVEDREIINPNNNPHNNTAINYPRFIKAILENAGKYIGIHSNAAGGSGMQVQTFKNQAYKDGKTRHGIEKPTQMAGSSILLYDQGADTRENSLKGLTEYMNMVPFGRYRGFNDGMAFWFGNNTFNDVLKQDPEIKTPEAALAFRQAMTLAMAVREPSRVLLNAKGFENAQARMNDTFIPRWVEAGIISAEAAERVKAVQLDFKKLRTNPIRPEKEVHDKATEALRINLINKLRITGADNEYLFNSMHVRAEATLYGDLNAKVAQMFDDANDPEKAKALGLVGSRYLLTPQTKPYDMKYSATIKRITPDSQALTRISVHNFPGQFDPNRQGMINTGSTNKPVFLASVEQMALVPLHKKYGGMTAAQLEAEKLPRDGLSQWALDYYKNPENEKTLSGLLDAYGNKVYLTTRACWFTGEGMNCPSNFENKGYGRMTVREILATSNNLGSYRITYDLQEYVKWTQLQTDQRVFDAADQSEDVQTARRTYATRFALYEGGVFQSRAFERIQKWPAFGTARAVDAYFASTEKPDATAMAAFVESACKVEDGKPAKCLTDARTLERLYDAHAPQRPALDTALQLLTAQSAPLSPVALMTAYRTVKPGDSYLDAREYVAAHADFQQAYDAAKPKPVALDSSNGNPISAAYQSVIDAFKPDAQLEKTQLLAAMLAKLPESKEGLSLSDQLTVLYGLRHPGANLASTLTFVGSHCISCLKNVAFGDSHKKYVTNAAPAAAVAALTERLAAATDRSPEALMDVYLSIRPQADFADARAFVAPRADFKHIFDAAQGDTSLEHTHELAAEMLSHMKPGSATKAQEPLMSLYGGRHPGANRAETLRFIQTYNPAAGNDAAFKKLHRSYVAAQVTDTTSPEIARLLVQRTSRQPTALAVTMFSVWPAANFDDMTDFLAAECKSACAITDKKMLELYQLHAPRQLAPVETLLAQGTDGSPQALMQLYRQLNPKADYAQARSFVSTANPASNAFADMNAEFNAATPDDSRAATDRLAALIKPTEKPADPDAARKWVSHEEQLAALYGKRHPGADYATTRSFILQHCKTCVKWSDFRPLHNLYKDGPTHDPAALVYHYSLDDRQYLAKVHPMALETGRMIGGNNKITLAEALDLTQQQRIDIYRKWLIEPKKLTAGKVKAQIKAATIISEQDTWAEITRFWHTLGYKYKLKPTLANVVAAPHNTDDLTTFTSILLNGGRTVASSSFTNIHIAEGTPHEMHSRPGNPHTTQVLDPEVAAHVVSVLRGGAETPEGTSRRLFGAFKREDGTPLVVFGKTGTSADASTGDFRGAFWMGGIGGCSAVTLGAYKYNAGPTDRFTSAVAAQMVKNLAPIIEEMERRDPCTNAASKEVPVKAPAGSLKADAVTPPVTPPATTPETKPTAAAGITFSVPYPELEPLRTSENWLSLGSANALQVQARMQTAPGGNAAYKALAPR